MARLWYPRLRTSLQSASDEKIREALLYMRNTIDELLEETEK